MIFFRVPWRFSHVLIGAELSLIIPQYATAIKPPTHAGRFSSLEFRGFGSASFLDIRSTHSTMPFRGERTPLLASGDGWPTDTESTVCESEFDEREEKETAIYSTRNVLAMVFSRF